MSEHAGKYDEHEQRRDREVRGAPADPPDRSAVVAKMSDAVISSSAATMPSRATASAGRGDRAGAGVLSPTLTSIGGRRATRAASCGIGPGPSGRAASVTARPSMVNRWCRPRREPPGGCARRVGERVRRRAGRATQRRSRSRSSGRSSRVKLTGRPARSMWSARSLRTAGVSSRACAAVRVVLGSRTDARHDPRVVSDPRGEEAHHEQRRRPPSFPSLSFRRFRGPAQEPRGRQVRTVSRLVSPTAAAAARARFGSRKRPFTPPGPLRCTGRKSSFSSYTRARRWGG